MVEVAGKMPTQNSVAANSQANQKPNPAANSDPSKAANALQAVSAPFQIRTTIDRQRWLKILIYGRHGAGKTELAGSSVDVELMQDVLMIDAESGDTVLEESPRIHNPDKISHIRVTTFKQVAYIHEFLKAYCIARDRNDIAQMKKLYCQVTGHDPKILPDDAVPRYRTVIIDSLTEVEVYCTYGILSIDAGKAMMEGEMDVAGWPEFRKNNEMVKLLVRAFRDLPMHVIFVCSEGWTQDEQKKFHYSPQLTGKLSAQVQGFVDIVGWMTVGSATADSPEAPRRMYVQPISGGPKFDAKNRRPAFSQAFFENPSMSSIMKDIGML